MLQQHLYMNKGYSKKMQCFFDTTDQKIKETKAKILKHLRQRPHSGEGSRLWDNFVHFANKERINSWIFNTSFTTVSIISLSLFLPCGNVPALCTKEKTFACGNIRLAPSLHYACITIFRYLPQCPFSASIYKHNLCLVIYLFIEKILV